MGTPYHKNPWVMKVTLLVDPSLVLITMYSVYIVLDISIIIRLKYNLPNLVLLPFPTHKVIHTCIHKNIFIIYS